MRLQDLLPRPLEKDGQRECAVLLGDMITAAHLDRRVARSLGWRGVKPSSTLHYAWTLRICGSPHVYGLVFCGEEGSETSLRGEFALYVFPGQDDPLLDCLPLEAMRLAFASDYHAKIRELSSHAGDLSPFCLGRIFLTLALDGQGMELELEAPSRLRVVALDGLPVPDGVGNGRQWLVQPGQAETDVPAFACLLRPFALMVATAEHIFAETAVLHRWAGPLEDTAYDAAGTISRLPQPHGRTLHCAARLGRLDGQMHPACQPMRSLPLRHRPRAEEADGRPLLHVLCGFLGAGKTTFLKQWLDFLHGRERFTGVLQNEFGEVDLDSLLLAGDTQVEALDEGCVCCSLADSLRPGIMRLKQSMPASQFILETTGVANPVNVMEALYDLDDLVIPGLVVCVVDSMDLWQKLRHDPSFGLHGIRLAQVERADILVANKADTLDAGAIQAVCGLLRTINPHAHLLQGRGGCVSFAELDAFYSACLDASRGRLPSRRPLLADLGHSPTHEDEGFGSCVVRFSSAVSEGRIRDLLARAGKGLCRAKGVVDLEGAGPRTLQYAAGTLAFDPGPKVVEDSFVVLIGQGLNTEIAAFDKGAEHDTH